jgi:hypothetical protein
LQKTGGFTDILIDAIKARVNEAYTELNSILKRNVEKENLDLYEFEKYFNVFEKDMQNTILESLMRGIFDKLIYILHNKMFVFMNLISIANQDSFEKAKLQILWNKSDQFLSTVDDLTQKPNHTEIITDLFECALLENRPEFVNLLIKNNFDLKKFPYAKLVYLYNYKVI